MTSFMPDCIIIFAQSLHGNNVTYIIQPFNGTRVFNMALNSEWHTGWDEKNIHVHVKVMHIWVTYLSTDREVARHGSYIQSNLHYRPLAISDPLL